MDVWPLVAWTWVMTVLFVLKACLWLNGTITTFGALMLGLGIGIISTFSAMSTKKFSHAFIPTGPAAAAARPEPNTVSAARVPTTARRTARRRTGASTRPFATCW